MISGKGHAGKVVSVVHPSDEAEAKWVAEQVKALASLEDAPTVLVCSRVNADLQPVSLALRELGIPHDLDSRQAWWEMPETAGLVDASRLALDPTNTQALCRLALWPVFGSDDVTGAMQRYLSAEPGEQVSALRQIAKPGRVERVLIPVLNGERVDRVFAPEHAVPLLGGRGKLAERADETLGSAVAAWRAIGDPERFLLRVRQSHLASRRRASVRLASAHAAKGGEADVVIVIGSEEGRWPHKKASDLAEERRVFPCLSG